MKLRFAAVVIASQLAVAVVAPASEAPGVRQAIHHYFQGHATGDGSHMRKAFLPTAHIEGMRDGRFVSWTVDEYVSRFGGKPAADEAQRKRTIDSVDVSGSAAMAKATLVHGNTTFTDYFVLLKVDGEWRSPTRSTPPEGTERSPSGPGRQYSRP